MTGFRAAISFLTVSILFSFTPKTAHTQPLIRTHNVGLLGLRVTNSGYFGGPANDGRNARWKDYEHLGLSGIWVGGIGSDQAAHVSAADAFEFAPSAPEIYESFEGQAGGIRIGLLGVEAADDDEDGQVDEDVQNGLDDDGDGQTDEDFQAIGQQMFSTTYEDGASGFPLGLLVRQRSFQWSVELNEIVGFDFEVINDGETDLTDVYLGLYCDANIGPVSNTGYATDDLAGWDRIDTTLFSPGPGDPCNTSMNLGPKTVFMWDAADDGVTASGGDAPGVFGTVLISHTTDVIGLRAPQQVDWKTATWIEQPGGMPADDAARYTLLSAGERPAGNPRPGVAKGSAILPGDYATLLSVGPFPTLHPGESVTFSATHVVGDGFPGFRRNVADAQKMAATLYLNVDNDWLTGIAGKERCLRALEGGEPVIWDTPCDTISSPIEWSSTECMWVDLDCNPCTGIIGAETLIHWAGRTAPPYPNTNLDPVYLAGLPPEQTLVVSPAGNGQVILQWDNLPEFWADPVTGVAGFFGYSIWRVSDWTGPHVPDPEDWVQIAQFTSDVNSYPNIHTIVNRDVDPIGISENGTPIYPVGRYAFVDSSVTNGQGYHYAITSFSSHATSGGGTIEFHGLPWTLADWLVVPCDLCNPVPTRLLSFTAERVGSTVHLSWAIADPDGLAGFHVSREVTGAAARVRISTNLITDGPVYAFVDEHAPLQPVTYWLEQVHRDGSTSWLGSANLGVGTGPTVFTVRSPSPNPFTTETRLAYALPDARRVRASIYDLNGRRIRVLLNQEKGSGNFTLQWNGETDAGLRAAPGLYILSLEAGRDRVSREILLLR